MIKSHQSFRFSDRGTGIEFFAEVNWNGFDNCEKVRFSFPGGEKVVIPRDALNAMLFAIGKPEDQMKMIPEVQTTNRHYDTVVSVRAKKRIEAGEEITFPISLTLPTLEQEIIAEAKRDVLKSSSNILA